MSNINMRVHNSSQAKKKKKKKKKIGNTFDGILVELFPFYVNIFE